MQNAAPRFRDCGENAVRSQQARKTADCRTICEHVHVHDRPLM